MSTTDTDRAGISVKGSLELAIGQLVEATNGVNQTVQKLHKFLTPNPIISPIVRPLRGVVTSDGSTYMLINLQPTGPSYGRAWDLRRLTVVRTTLAAGGFADTYTSVASVIAGIVIRSTAVPNVGVSNLTGFDDLIIGATVANTPFTQTWSSHEVTLIGGQSILVAIKGTTSGDQYFASGQAEEYLESSHQEIQA